MCLLCPFITDCEGITTHPFGQPVKFKFLRSPEPREISSLQEVSVFKTLNLINAKISLPTFSFGPNQAKNLDHFVLVFARDQTVSLKGRARAEGFVYASGRLVGDKRLQ